MLALLVQQITLPNEIRSILRAGEIEVLRCSRIRENSGGKSARVRILTNPATTHVSEFSRIRLQLMPYRFKYKSTAR